MQKTNVPPVDEVSNQVTLGVIDLLFHQTYSIFLVFNLSEPFLDRIFEKVQAGRRNY
jgi:hypothetical protein